MMQDINEVKQKTGGFVEGLERFEALQGLAKSGLGKEGIASLFDHASIRGRTLFFVFKHPAAKPEFEHKKEQIKERMRVHYKQNRQSMADHEIYFKEVSCQIKHKPGEKRDSDNTLPVFNEKSTGEFEIKSINPKLTEQFKRIQDLIKQNREQ